MISGGPGSGKVTHCDNLADEKQGVVHINMSDLLQQYAVGAGNHITQIMLHQLYINTSIKLDDIPKKIKYGWNEVHK